jgi:hypothetical protein
MKRYMVMKTKDEHPAEPRTSSTTEDEDDRALATARPTIEAEPRMKEEPPVGAEFHGEREFRVNVEMPEGAEPSVKAAWRQKSS